MKNQKDELFRDKKIAVNFPVLYILFIFIHISININFDLYFSIDQTNCRFE
jgi:hypothetical protein